MNQFALDNITARFQNKLETHAEVSSDHMDNETDFFSFHGIQMTSEDVFADFSVPTFSVIAKEAVLSLLFTISYAVLFFANASISTAMLVGLMLVVSVGMITFHVGRFYTHRHQGFMIILNTVLMLINCGGAIALSIVLLGRFLNF